jgi:hypothetical protein
MYVISTKSFVILIKCKNIVKFGSIFFYLDLLSWSNLRSLDLNQQATANELLIYSEAWLYGIFFLFIY